MPGSIARLQHPGASRIGLTMQLMVDKRNQTNSLDAIIDDLSIPLPCDS
jgi:hypothetical protein